MFYSRYKGSDYLATIIIVIIPFLFLNWYHQHDYQLYFLLPEYLDKCNSFAFIIFVNLSEDIKLCCDFCKHNAS